MTWRVRRVVGAEAVPPQDTFGHATGWRGSRRTDVGTQIPACHPSVPTRPQAPESVRAGDENRTRVASLEDWGSTIELRPRRCGGRTSRDHRRVYPARTGPASRSEHRNHRGGSYQSAPESSAVGAGGSVTWSGLRCRLPGQVLRIGPRVDRRAGHVRRPGEGVTRDGGHDQQSAECHENLGQV